MDIRNTRSIKSLVPQRLSQARDGQKIVLIYAGLSLGLTALVTILSYVLNQQISQTGGLGQIGTRSFLSTIRIVVLIAQWVALLCLDLGYQSAALRIARGQYASVNSLRLGFDRFWPLIRCTLVQCVIYVGIFLLSLYAAVTVYLITPLSDSAMEILTPLVTEAASAGESVLVLDDEVYAQLEQAMLPALIICFGLFCAISLPFYYRYRMANYVLIDRPALGAVAVLRESRKMMKGNRIPLFRLDLSLWWYYAAGLLAMAVGYGDQILPALGISLPFSDDVAYFLFYGLYLAVMFLIYYAFGNRIQVTYALAYDSVKPPEPNGNGGVVLGNIFQM